MTFNQHRLGWLDLRATTSCTSSSYSSSNNSTTAAAAITIEDHIDHGREEQLLRQRYGIDRQQQQPQLRQFPLHNSSSSSNYNSGKPTASRMESWRTQMRLNEHPHRRAQRIKLAINRATVYRRAVLDERRLAALTLTDSTQRNVELHCSLPSADILSQQQKQKEEEEEEDTQKHCHHQAAWSLSSAASTTISADASTSMSLNVLGGAGGSRGGDDVSMPAMTTTPFDEPLPMEYIIDGDGAGPAVGGTLCIRRRETQHQHQPQEGEEEGQRQHQRAEKMRFESPERIRCHSAPTGKGAAAGLLLLEACQQQAKEEERKMRFGPSPPSPDTISSSFTSVCLSPHNAKAMALQIKAPVPRIAGRLGSYG